MKLKVLSENLNKVLTRAGKVSSDRELLPIYAYLRLEAHGENRLRITAVSSKAEYSEFVEAEIQDGGEVVIETARFERLMKTRTDGHPVQLELKNNFLTLKQGEFRGKIGIFEASEQFPQVTQNEDKKAFRISLSEDFFDALEWGLVPLSESGRLGLGYGGLLFDFTPQSMRIAGFGRGLIHLGEMGGNAYSQHCPERFVLSQPSVDFLKELKGEEGLEMILPEGNKVLFESKSVKASFTKVVDEYPQDYMDTLKVDLGGDDYSVGDVDRKKIDFDDIGDFLSAVETAKAVLGQNDLTVVMKVGSKTKDKHIVSMIGLDQSTGAKSEEKLLAESELDKHFIVGFEKDEVAKSVGTLGRIDGNNFRMWVSGGEDLVVIVPKVQGDLRLVGILIPKVVPPNIEK